MEDREAEIAELKQQKQKVILIEIETIHSSKKELETIIRGLKSNIDDEKEAHIRALAAKDAIIEGLRVDLGEEKERRRKDTEAKQTVIVSLNRNIAELQDKHKEDKKADEAATRELKETINELKVKHQKYLDAREPLLQVGIATHWRFLERAAYPRGTGDQATIHRSNTAIHHSNMAADASLYALGYLSEAKNALLFTTTYLKWTPEKYRTQTPTFSQGWLEGLNFRMTFMIKQASIDAAILNNLCDRLNEMRDGYLERRAERYGGSLEATNRAFDDDPETKYLLQKMRDYFRGFPFRGRGRNA